MEDSQNIPASSLEGTSTQPPGNQSSSTPSGDEISDDGSHSNRGRAIIIGIVLVVILAVLIAAFVFLLRAAPGVTSQIRDVFIIFMALEALVIGVALIILVVQLAVLINLLQNEIKPILNSTNETVSTLRGTIVFLSNNLTEPVIKINSYMAGAKKLVDLVRPGRR